MPITLCSTQIIAPSSNWKCKKKDKEGDIKIFLIQSAPDAGEVNSKVMPNFMAGTCQEYSFSFLQVVSC